MRLEAPGPAIVWFRRDLRLADNAALSAAAATGRPVLPLFIHDETVEPLGAAPRFRLGLSVESLAERLRMRGLRLILRRGRALDVLKEIADDTGAGRIYWTRYHEPVHLACDRAVTHWASSLGIEARAFAGALLHDPSRLLTTSGRPYSVFTPFWRRLAASEIAPPLPEPAVLNPVTNWPASDDLADWRMARSMNRGAEVVRPWLRVGERAAHDRLAAFLSDDAAHYARNRDLVAIPGTSALSEHLAWGEISPRQVWHLAEATGAGGSGLLSQLGWRDFAWHLMAHFPALASRNWRPGWDRFGWLPDGNAAEAWRRGMTGIGLVDAGMRELYVTGRMHNRVRMVVASYLTKHLLTDWRVGLRWFADCLIDWDPAANAMNWQWVAGSGPDAAPYFRIFNPDTQAERFDPDGAYRKRWLVGRDGDLSPEASSYFQAVPRRWGLHPAAGPQTAVEPLAAGRERALAAYRRLKEEQ